MTYMDERWFVIVSREFGDLCGRRTTSRDRPAPSRLVSERRSPRSGPKRSSSSCPRSLCPKSREGDQNTETGTEPQRKARTCHAAYLVSHLIPACREASAPIRRRLHGGEEVRKQASDLRRDVEARRETLEPNPRRHGGK